MLVQDGAPHLGADEEEDEYVEESSDDEDDFTEAGMDDEGMSWEEMEGPRGRSRPPGIGAIMGGRRSIPPAWIGGGGWAEGLDLLDDAEMEFMAPPGGWVVDMTHSRV